MSEKKPRLCRACSRSVIECNRSPCETKSQQRNNQRPASAPPKQQQQQNTKKYNDPATYQRSPYRPAIIQEPPNPALEFLRNLHNQRLLTHRIHKATVSGYAYEGLVVDVLVSEPLSDKQIGAQCVLPQTVLGWNCFSWLSHWSIEDHYMTAQQRLPIGSTFNVYATAFDPINGRLTINMPRRPFPILSNIIRAHPLPITSQRPRFLVIVDFEATCDYAPEPIVTSYDCEIIEFPWLVFDTHTMTVIHDRQIYVRPDSMHGITAYCTKLTGITADQCRDAISLIEALNQFNEYIQKELMPYGSDSFMLVTDGPWDLQVQLRTEAQRKGIELESWYRRYFDLRHEFRQTFPWFNFSVREPSLSIMLKSFRLEFCGRHHCGLDDCRTIMQVVAPLLAIDASSFTKPKEIADDYNPYEDESWDIFMGQSPPDAWFCDFEDCKMWNRPESHLCRFCRSPRIG